MSTARSVSLGVPALLCCALSVGAVASASAQCTPSQQLLAPDAMLGDRFGLGVAISADRAVVGAREGDSITSNTGAVYIYRREGHAWVFEAKIVADDGADGDLFGFSVAIDGETIVVGAPGVSGDESVSEGAAYVFVRSGDAWMQQARLAIAEPMELDGFGTSVGISDDTVIVGAPGIDGLGGADQGSATIFIRSGDAWSEQAKLLASDAAAADAFAFSVAISGETVLVGARLDNGTAGNDQGSAYVFTRSGTAWTEQAHLFASDAAAADHFGFAAALRGDTALIGARLDNGSAGNDQGSAYVFVRSGTAWSQQAKLLAADPGSLDFFGTAVSLADNTAMVGARNDNGPAGNDQGSAYIFTRAGTVWTQRAKLTAPDAATLDFFGSAVAILGDAAVVGADLDDGMAGMDQGSAYVFRRAGPSWTNSDFFLMGDSNRDGRVNFNDVLSSLANFGAVYSPGTGIGDANGNGIVNSDDVAAALANFGAACP